MDPLIDADRTIQSATNLLPAASLVKWETLPADALALIFLRAGPEAFPEIKKVCHRFKSIINTDLFVQFAIQFYKLPVGNLPRLDAISAAKVYLAALSLNICQPGDSVATLKRLLEVHCILNLDNAYTIDHQAKTIYISSEALRLHQDSTVYLDKLKTEIGDHPYLNILKQMTMPADAHTFHRKYPKLHLLEKLIPNILKKCPPETWVVYKPLDMPRESYFTALGNAREPGAPEKKYKLRFVSSLLPKAPPALKASL